MIHAKILKPELSLIFKRCGFVGPTEHMYVKAGVNYMLCVHPDKRFTTAPEAEDLVLPAPYINQVKDWLIYKENLYFTFDLASKGAFKHSLKHRSLTGQDFEIIKEITTFENNNSAEEKLIAYALDYLSKKYSLHFNSEKPL